MSSPVTKKDLASVDRDLEAELDSLPQPDLRYLAKQALRTIYYDRARSANYMHENKEKRREYYLTVLKPKRERAKLEAALCAAPAPACAPPRRRLVRRPGAGLSAAPAPA